MPKAIKYEAFLKLETGTHTGKIRQMLVSPDGRSLVTAGGDKSIRVWDIETKKQTSMLLGEIGPGANGSIQAIALSPDGNYVVSLAWMYSDDAQDAQDRETSVRVFELATGNLQAGFMFPGTLQDLDFSPDGRYLTVVGNRKAPIRQGHVYIYETNKIIKGFGKEPKPLALDALFDENALIPSYVRFIPKTQKGAADYGIVVATWLQQRKGGSEYTGMLKWYSFSKTGGLKKTFERDTEELLTPEALTVSSTHTVITTHHGDSNKFYCHAHSGELIAQVISETNFGWPAFSRDEKHLIVGQKGDSALVQVKVYAFSQKQFQLKSIYYGHDAEVAAVAMLDDGTAVSAGGNQYALHFWDPEHLEGKKLDEISGAGRIVHGVGINSLEQIGIGNHEGLLREDGKTVLQRLFDLRAMNLRASTLDDEATYRRAQTGFGEMVLKWIFNGNVNLWLLPYQIPFTGVPQVKWYHPSSFGFTENGTVIVGASDGKIRVSPPNPEGGYDVPTRLLIGHSARVIDHAACGKWLVTSGADQIIRLWFMDDVKERTQTDLRPALNLFVGSDDEWVIWSEGGFYNASQHGDKRFGYHVNRGSNMEALYFHSDRFYKSFYRPDIIHAILEHGSEERALATLSKQGKSPEKLNISKILPPIVEWSAKGVAATKDKVTFKFTVQELNPDTPITRVWIVQNDRFAWAGKRKPAQHTVTLPLAPGMNRFKILAETQNTKSMPLRYSVMGPEPKPGSITKPQSRALGGTVTAKGAKAAEEARSQANTYVSNDDNGTLFLLAVGVSTLKNETDDFKSLTFADDDAVSIYNAFGRMKLSGKLDKKASLKNKAFQSVEATILLNEDATKEAILEAVDKICNKIRKRDKPGKKERDVLMVFLSGHGIRRADDFERELYFWSYDLDKSSTRATGLSFIELGEKITALPADVILATDACHSGMSGSDLVRGLDPNELAKRMYAINERGMYILNAARSEELALESGREDIQHGIFTKSILEALEFESDLSMMNLMASIQRRVLYYTNHQQTPVFRMYGDLLPLIVYKK